MNYTVGDIVIRIKNAVQARRRKVSFNDTKLTKAILKLLAAQGYLGSIKEDVQENKKVLVADIASYSRQAVFSDVEIISKPSLRVYANAAELSKKQRQTLGQLIVSTSNGLMTGKEAIKKGLGGELLFAIW